VFFRGIKMKASLFITIVSLFLLSSGTIIAGEKDMNTIKPEYKYTITFNTKHTYCEVLLNGVGITDNYFSNTGSISTGLTVTAFLQNNHNDFSLYVASLDGRQGIKELREGAECNASLNINNEKERLEITSLRAVAGEDNYPTGIESKEYPIARTSEVKDMGFIDEGSSTIFEIARSVNLLKVPEWEWTKATPFNNNRENIKALQAAYKKVWDVMNSRHFGDFKNITRIAMSEYALADGESLDDMYASLPYEEVFKNENFKMLPLEFKEKYQFQSFAGGKLLRISTVSGNSPLRYIAENGRVHTYNPYFSMFKDKIILTR